jgi:hypothetical protein
VTQAIDLPDTLEAAHALLREQAALIHDLRSENVDLKQQLDQHARRLFGKRSEQLDAEQLRLGAGAREHRRPLNASDGPGGRKAQPGFTGRVQLLRVPGHRRTSGRGANGSPPRPRPSRTLAGRTRRFWHAPPFAARAGCRVLEQNLQKVLARNTGA